MGWCTFQLHTGKTNCPKYSEFVKGRKQEANQNEMDVRFQVLQAADT
jgi:hypothetical protein